MVASGLLAFSRHPSASPRASFRDPVAASETGRRHDERHRTRERSQAVRAEPHGRLPPGSSDHRRSGTDGSPRWHRHGRGRRRHFGCRRPNQLASAHWRGVDDEDRREGAVAIPERAAWIVRARNRPGRISPVSGRRHPYRGRGHHRKNACSHVGSARGLDCGARIRLAPRRPKPGLRDSVRRRGPRRDPDEAIQLPGLGQDRARHLADVSVRQQRPRVRLRFRRGSESVSPRWHEHHRDRQRRVEGRSRRRLHSGAADPVGGRVGRVRQRPGRRRQRHHQIRREPLSVRCGLLLANRCADQPAGAARVQSGAAAGQRLRARGVS